MSIGFTGTRQGMSPAQKETVNVLLSLWALSCDSITRPTLEQGDCVGSDAEAVEIASQLGYAIISRPMKPATERAFVVADRVYPAKDPLARDRDIVDAATVMLATPYGYKYIKRGSGTWYTIGYTGVVKRPLIVIWRTGMPEYYPEGWQKEDGSH